MYKGLLLALAVAFMSIIYKLSKAASEVKNTVKYYNPMTYSIDKFTFRNSPNGPLPIFFFSHGGPTFCVRDDKFGGDAGAWDTTKAAGQYIRDVLKPDYIICVSAHWQAEFPDTIEVSVPGPKENRFMESSTKSKKVCDDENALIYDFYNFPQVFYDTQFHTLANKAIANDIAETISDSKYFMASTRERGIDHGVWVPLRVAFGDCDTVDTKKIDLDIPLIQVSLAGTDDIEIHYRLGEALQKYRDLNGVLIFSGMSVHNLRDMQRAFMTGKKAMGYVEPFNKILTQILTSAPETVLPQLKELPNKEEWRRYYRLSHPTNEHFLPVAVAAGAANMNTCREVYTDSKGSLGWNIYRWPQGPANLSEAAKESEI